MDSKQGKLRSEHDVESVRGYGVSRHFQQYSSYIVMVSCIGGENHRPAASMYRIHLA